MPFTWQRRPTEAFPALTEAYAQAIHRGVVQLAQRYAVEIEAWMKANAVWQDRTGNARATLFAEAIDFVDVVVILMSHGVEYSTFLELSHGGRFSVLTPALDHYIPRIWRDVQALLR
jgi:hypothetical protein